MNLFNAAIKAYQERNYAQALSLFEQAGSCYGFELVQANIHMCRKALNTKREDEAITTDSSGSGGRFAAPLQHSIATVFDQVYLVNLKSKVKRRLSSAAQLRRYGISFTLFDAVDGYVGDVYERYKVYAAAPLGSIQRYPQFNEREIARGKKFIESAGAFGYIETYLAILHQAKQHAFRRILILEDDVILHPSFHAKFNEFIERIPCDWKVIQLGASQYGWQSINEPAALARGYYAPRSLDTCGSFAIGIDSSVYDEIIKAESAFEAPFDHIPMGEIYERHLGQCHVVYPNIVMPDVADSSIRHQREQRTHSQKMRWRMEEFAYPLPEPTLAIQLTSPANLRYFDRFGKGEDTPYQLSLYVLGEDGVRPVHDARFFDLPPNQCIETTPIASLPPADCHARIDPDKTLTEQDILNFLDNQLLGRSLPTALQALAYHPQPVISGRVSVIIPTYSRTRNLSAALDSVAKQDYPDIQLIVVSDNPPNTNAASEAHALLETFRKSHPGLNMKVIQHRHNRNGAAARNTGILHSDGEFVCFLDDDDVYLPGRVSVAVAALRGEPDGVGAVYCGFLGWNSPRDDPQRYKGGDLTRELLLLDYKKHYLHTNTATYRRSALLHINGFDETYRRHQDLELNLRFFERYDIGVVRHTGVRLSPEPSGVDNKLFNSNFLALKQKFLDRFHHTIEALGPEAASSVYQRHWGEVMRYVKDRNEVDAHLQQIRANGALQVALLLSQKVESAVGTIKSNG